MYTSSEKVLIWMSLVEGMTNAKADKLLSYYERPIDIYKRLEQDAEIIKIAVGEAVYGRMLKTTPGKMKAYLEMLENKGVKCVTRLSDDFPAKLSNIDNAPYILFCKGDTSLLNKRGVAVVGTRRPTAYGRETTANFAKTLAERGLVIVSGLAEGVDKIAHETTLKAGGKTIAVLASGFNTIYPAMNTNLANQIAEEGLLVSEHRPDEKSTKYAFITRNRIVSGLSDAVLITEAAEKSGTMHTRDFALAQDRLIFAVPGNITSKNSAGTNKIIKDMQAIMAIHPNDILLQLHIPLVSRYEEVEKPKVVVNQSNSDEALIIKALEDGEQTMDSLQEITKLSTKTLNSYLTILQIRGLIKKLPGNSYSI